MKIFKKKQMRQLYCSREDRNDSCLFPEKIKHIFISVEKMISTDSGKIIEDSGTHISLTRKESLKLAFKLIKWCLK